MYPGVLFSHKKIELVWLCREMVNAGKLITFLAVPNPLTILPSHLPSFQEASPMHESS
jgi:hypothetical protein